MMQIAKQIVADIKNQANQEKAQQLQRFFKTGPGAYAEGDRFLGLTVPQQRVIVRKYREQIALNDLSDLIKSPYHEIRLVCLLLLVELYQKAHSHNEKKELVDFYLQNTAHINNWDLVDFSADKILGQYLYAEHLKQNQTTVHQVPELLIKLATSDILWERRIAVLSTFPFIKGEEFLPTFKLAKILINDQEDLIQKAVGWLLREVGKKDEKALTDFLDQYALHMPRAMLRYSIEKFSEQKRQHYLKKS
jgi:3-methyladenine DNA glycosylase AlkD